MRAFGGVRETRRPGQAGNAATAAKSENRQPFHGRRELEAVEKLGIEARNGQSGHRVGHEHVDRVQSDTGGGRRLDGYLLQEVERVLLKRGGAFLPAMRLEVPVDRLAIVAQLDTGIIVERPQRLEMRVKLPGPCRGLGLRQFEGRIGGRDRQDFDVEPVRGCASPGLRLDRFQHGELRVCAHQH
jgi:hypothetical protein